MSVGYLVTLGDGSLGASDSISGAQTSFTIDSLLGTGRWTWSGQSGGTAYSGFSDGGTYFLGDDGNVYFTPDNVFPDSGNGTVESAPAYSTGAYHGSDGADSHSSGAGDDFVIGGGGDDTLRGSFGEDTIIGGDGDDSIYGNEDSDSMEGGAGADSIYGEFGDDYVSGGAGDDHLEGNEGADTIVGGDGDDWMRGSYDNDELWGGTGDDYLWGGYNDDTFHMENDFGDDTIAAEGIDEVAGDTLDLSLVTDDLRVDLRDANPERGSFSDGVSTASFNEIENIVLGGGRDTIVLADLSGADRVLAFDISDSGDGTSMDRLDVSGLTSDWGTTPVTTDDVSVGDDGAGNAVLSFPGGESITLMGVAPSALGDAAALEAIGVSAGSGPVSDHVVDGTSGADTIDAGFTGDPDGDRIDAGDAADGSDRDLVYGHGGDDVIDAGAADDTVHGGDGDDLISGGAGDDSLKGGAGDDTISGGAGNDEISLGLAGGDADLLQMGDGGGSDVVTAFEAPTDNGDGTYGGIDQIDVSDLHDAGGDPVTAEDVTVSDTVGDGTGDAILSFPGGEKITLLGVSVGQVSSPAQLEAMGIPAAPVVSDFVVEGTSGADIIDGAYLGDPQGDRIDAGDAADGSDDDSVEAGAGSDTVNAGLGDDKVRAGAGDDLVRGDAGADWLEGNDGNDTLEGGAGADTLIGGAGDDVLHVAEGDNAKGGAGDDTFHIADLGEPGASAITVIGGEDDETAGDTLDFGGLTDWSAVTYSNTDPGAGGGLSGSAKLHDGSVVTFSEIEKVVICFTAGTRIATADGPRPVEALRRGDLVVTRDHGLQKLRWAGQRRVAALGSLAPVRFEAGVLGNTRPLLVSPQHRMLITGPEAVLLFGESEVLASAKHLTNGGTIRQVPGGEVRYVHLLFDRHEIIYAEGAASESFFPGDTGIGAVDEAAREELFTLFPELRSSTGGFEKTARICLRRHESRLFGIG